MATQGLSKNLPKRAAKDHRSHITRQRSRNAREALRQINIIANQKAHENNLKRGYTGKQLDNAIRKYAKARGENYRFVKDLMNSQTELYIASEMGLI